MGPSFQQGTEGKEHKAAKDADPADPAKDPHGCLQGQLGIKNLSAHGFRSCHLRHKTAEILRPRTGKKPDCHHGRKQRRHGQLCHLGKANRREAQFPAGVEEIGQGQEDKWNTKILVGKLRRPNKKQKSQTDLNQCQAEFNERVGIAIILTKLNPKQRKHRSEKQDKSGIEGLSLTRGYSQKPLIWKLRISLGKEVHGRTGLLEQGPKHNRPGDKN